MGIDVTQARRFVSAIEQAAPYPLQVRSWAIEADAEFRRTPGSLPLWLEPDIDYEARIIRVDPKEYDDGLPPPSVLLHEVAHLALTDVLAPHRQTPWLAEAICDFLAASWLETPVLHLISTRYPELARTLDHRLRYPEDVLTEVTWLRQVAEGLARTDLADRYPDVIQLVADSVEAADDKPQPHSVGQVLGGALWQASSQLGRDGMWTAVLAALRSDPRPAGALDWVASWLGAVEKHCNRTASDIARSITTARGLSR